MKKLLLLLLLLTSPVFGQAWVRTHTALRTIYATSNSNFGKLFESATANYMGLEDNPSVRYNDIEMVSGAAGNAVSITGNTCTGTCDEPYAQLYYADTLDDTTWSVSWWFNSSSAVGGNMWASWATTGPQLAAVVTCNITSLGQVTCSVKDDAAVTFTITSSSAADGVPDKTNGSWHHAVLVAEAANIHRLYIDGTLSVSNTTTTIGAKTEMGALVLNPNGSSAYTGNYIGLIDELQIYSDAKNAANVTTLYNAGTPNVVGLTNITTHYHFNEEQPGLDTDHRIDFDQIDAWIRPGDEVLLEAVNADPGYLSDRPKEDIDYTCTVTDVPPVERFCFLGPWYTVTTSGTQANPILFKCEGDWPSDCRFQSRVEWQGDFQWVWGMWFTGVQGNNTTFCKTSDNGPASVSLEGRGSALINNWLYHPANFPLVTSVPPTQAYQTTGFDFSSYTTSYAPSSSLDGYTGGFFTQQAQGPERVVYGNIMNGGGHGIYSQNDYNGSGYAYYIQNMYQNQGEDFLCDPDHFPTAESTASKTAGFWSTSNEVGGFYLYHNFFADMEGDQAADTFFHVSQGDPSHHSIIDTNEFFCGGRMITPPNNGRISFGTGTGIGTLPAPSGTGHPAQIQFTNNYAASCAFYFPYLWGRGEVLYPQDLPTTITGNTILFDNTFVDADEAMYLRTSAYVATNQRSDGIPLIRAEDIINNNTYVNNAEFTLRAGNAEYENRTLTQWKAETTTEGGSAIDSASTASTAYPVTGSRVVLYRNEYDNTLGNLIIYNWAEAATVDVNFTAVCPLCSRFDLYDADEAPNASPVLSNVVNIGADIPVPMDGDLVKLFRIHILSGE